MSSITWTPEELSSNHVVYDGGCWRAVEAQHRVSTMKLVDTRPEQEILEDIIESTKPPVPDECKDLKFLLFTPFRYGAVYPRGSRFRRAGKTLGVFYAAESPETAIAEMVFYRYLFFAESPGTALPANPSEYTVFQARLKSSLMIDLTRHPLNIDCESWRDPNSYEACQAIADTARAGGTEIIRYESARDPARGINYAVLKRRAFYETDKVSTQSWHIHLKIEGALATCESPKMGLSYKLSDFSDDKRLTGLLSKAA